MPTRSWTAAGENYRFGFNGKENDDETYGNNNELDFGARIYDPRLGRWFSTDPFNKKYLYLSPYVGIEDNPISILDIGGDSTVYYNQKGEQLGVSWDNLPNGITVIPNANLEKFKSDWQMAKTHGITDGTLTNKTLRTLGITYDYASLKEFAETKEVTKSTDYVPTDGKGPFNNEQGKCLYVIDDNYDPYTTVVVGPGVQLGATNNPVAGASDDGSPASVGPARPYNKTLAVGDVHLHTNSGRSFYNKNLGYASWYSGVESISSEDRNRVAKPGYYNIALEQNAVLFFNYGTGNSFHTSEDEKNYPTFSVPIKPFKKLPHE